MMVQEIGVTVEILSLDATSATALVYDPESDYDISVGVGIAPNRIVGDQLLNGVRYTPGYIWDGAFTDNMAYLEKAPTVMSVTDEAQHSEITYELLKWYEENVLTFALCTQLVGTAYSSKIDTTSIVYSVGTGISRYQDLKAAG